MPLCQGSEEHPGLCQEEPGSQRILCPRSSVSKDPCVLLTIGDNTYAVSNAGLPGTRAEGSKSSKWAMDVTAGARHRSKKEQLRDL